MQFKDFTRMNVARCEAVNGFRHPLRSWSVELWLTALVGEVGEVAGVIKDIRRLSSGINHGKDLNAVDLRNDLADELADVYTYLDLLVVACGLDMESILLSKFQKVSERIGYTPTMVPTKFAACASCGQQAELRPYGHNNSYVCINCAFPKD